ncbi:MAG: helix-turn-helix domain-containing protein [Bacteroidetes bacterium]|nr:helix-turn-helix domain-containing protein [Bacteroidota bacterium]
MQNLVLSPIGLDDLIDRIAQKTTSNILNSLNTHNDNEENENVSPKEAQKILGVTHTTLWRWQKQGLINLYGIGGKRYFKRSELQLTKKAI